MSIYPIFYHTQRILCIPILSSQFLKESTFPQSYSVPSFVKEYICCDHPPHSLNVISDTLHIGGVPRAEQSIVILMQCFDPMPFLYLAESYWTCLLKQKPS